MFRSICRDYAELEANNLIKNTQAEKISITAFFQYFIIYMSEMLKASKAVILMREQTNIIKLYILTLVYGIKIQTKRWGRAKTCECSR